MTTVPDSRDPMQRAAALVGLFCSPREFGVLRGVTPREVPEPSRTLLDHRSHMTVAMERFHGGDVRLRVVAVADGGSGGSTREQPYAREILLETRAGRVVQFGIVRIHMAHLDPATAATIREARRPLGRILIEAGMLREVQGVHLLEITPGSHLRRLLGMSLDGTTTAVAATAGTPSDERVASGTATTSQAVTGRCVYGRVADIRLDGRPAIELLEIVAPVELSAVG